ncbi:dUTP diphosphatase [Virgibacillus litoralis]|uniref:Dimeric dUTPase (All-alpha-NTP-PPase superfamily) n=1 Tax=Virgibacillus litoralis TaxID=578221 RepID=A0ABS4HA05_9BACI|nr:dUTP diphosphatase [Virgibacillus litoralis]MBP1947739.1 dimeric dUTPase (all-alpha-NTP-PPase superfamily) [Virgibacillus litoralis]
MDWSELYTMQKQLDNYIESQHDLTGKDIFEEKNLALLVELGELANETRCFKFWSKKPRNEDAVILEEYVDGIHFILSLGLEKGYEYTSTRTGNSSRSETEQFNHVFNACVIFKQQPTQANYEVLFEYYLQLGELLGFDEEAVQDAYLKKNEINYERQNKGY